jgi:septum formation inhibitor-activating ATPase MinD
MRTIMENQEGSGTVVEMAATKRRRPAARKAASAPGRRPRKTVSRRKPASRRKSAAKGVSFESVIRSITGGVAVARAAIAEASEEGASAVRRAAGTASKASRKTITRLAGEWKSMEPRKKASLLAALLGAAAAASVPLMRKSLKK